MLNFFKSLFSSSSNNSSVDEQQKDNKKNFEIFKYDGLRAQRMGQANYAVKCFNKALDLQEDFETMGYLSQLYTQTGELDSARHLIERMTELEPNLANTYLDLANTCFTLEDYTAMEAAAQKAIELESENAMGFYLLAKARKAQKDEIMVIAHTTKAIALKEDFIEARLMRTETLIDLKQYKEASEDVEAVLKMNDQEENALLYKAKIEEVNGDEAKAEQVYQQVIEVNPFNQQAFLYLGQLFINQKKLAEAIELFNEAIDLNPHFAQAYYERGRAKLLNGDKDGSIEDMKTSLEMNPKAESALNGQFNNQETQSTNILGL